MERNLDFSKDFELIKKLDTGLDNITYGAMDGGENRYYYRKQY
jgi:hypothetical protein